MTHLDLPEERNHSYRHAEWKRLLHVGHASSGICACEGVEVWAVTTRRRRGWMDRTRRERGEGTCRVRGWRTE